MSRSNPGAEALAALSACGVSLKQGAKRDQIQSMGRIEHARDAKDYVLLFGVERELKTESPAWIIQFVGRVETSGYWGIDPFCVVVDGQASFYDPKENGLVGDPEVVSPPLPAVLPTRSLPSMAP